MIRECIVIHSLWQGFLLTSVISFGRDGDVWCSVFFGQCFQRSSIPSKWAKILAHPFKTSMCLSLRSSDLVSFRVSFLDVHVWIFTIVYKRVELYLYVCVLIQKDTQDTTVSFRFQACRRYPSFEFLQVLHLLPLFMCGSNLYV